MNDRDTSRLAEIAEFGERAIRLVGEKDLTSFSVDEATLYAVHYCLQVIGEAANSLSMEAKAELLDVPWQDVVAMRHKLVHHYQAISPAILYATVLGPLAELLE